MAMDWYSKKVNPRGLAVKPRIFRNFRFLIVIVLSSALAVFGADLYHIRTSASNENELRLLGLSSMTQLQLRDTVSSNHLVVYWAGPREGANYLLDTVEANVTVLTVLPPGQREAQTRTSYPQFATYVQKDAYKIVLNGGNNPNVSGFVNPDGNSVFFTSLDPKNVFVGIKGKDIEVQIFHPVQGESLAIANTRGMLVPITKATG